VTPPGGVRYPSVWEQESAPPLPRREPRGQGRTGEDTGDHPFPRRRDLRAPSPHAGHGAAAPSPRSPGTGSIPRPQFPATLPPGVIRLDEQSVRADDTTRARSSGAEADTGSIAARRGRTTLWDDHITRTLSRPARRTPAGPATGSLDIDADLFTPAAERLARQSATGGVAARHTPSAGLALGHLQALPAAATTAPAPDGAPTVPGLYPRRRDLRRQGRPASAPASGSLPLPPQAPSGLALVPAQSQASPHSGEIPCPGENQRSGENQSDAGLRRRRDLRVIASSPAVADQAGSSDSAAPAEQAGSGDRTGAIAVGVARAAVMTMLVGVGYAVVSGHQLSLDVVPETAGTTDAAGAMMAAGARPGERARVTESDWDVRGEVAQIESAAERQTKVRVAAAKAAAARARAAKAAAAARAARLAEASRAANRNPKAVAKLLAAQRGWGNTQFTCLDLLWTKESGWNYQATNRYSGAYGIPQALPGSKMASVGANWRTSATTQIKWGLDYIADRYGTPCGAWSHSKATGWY
jgi:hypothetical protein